MLFNPLITNPSPDPGQCSPTEGRVRDYLERVLQGEQGRPFCPFVPLVYRCNGYVWGDFSGPPSELCFTQMVAELTSEFWCRSPRPTDAKQTVDITTIVASFSHAECQSAAFGERLEKARNQLRQLVLNQGLMLAHMFERHSDPKGGGRYVSRIPLLMVRRMHEQDKVFMRLPAELETYHRFFPERT